MRYFFLLALFFIPFQVVKAQQIQVLDAKTKEPLFNVAIFNPEKTKSVITNFDGKANISEFFTTEKLIFSHVGYEKFTLLKSEILRQGKKVYLQQNANYLDEVVLSVSNFEQSRRKIPQKVVQISSEEITLFNPQTSADLLESSGLVYVQKSQLGGGSPMIRGFATNRLLLTVDGVRMNNAIFRGGNLQNVISIDPLAISRTEVILGAGPVLYGSDAIGGVMNFYTLEPQFSSEEKMLFTGSAFSRYATANNEKTGHVDFNFGFKEWAFLSSASFSDFDDLRMGSNGPAEYLRNEYVITKHGEDIVVENDNPLVQNPTGYEQLNLLQKVKFKPSEVLDFNLGLYYSTTSNYARYDRLTQKRDGQFRSAEWYYGPQEWLFGNLGMSHQKDEGFYDHFKATAAYQFFRESRHNRDFGDEVLYHNEEQVDAYSANFDFEKNLNSANLFYGFEYIFNRVSSTGTAEDIFSNEKIANPSRYPNGSIWQSLAAYTSYHREIVENLNLQTGLRYSHVLINASFEDSLYDFPFTDANTSTGALTGSAGLSWEQTDFLIWKMNLSTAFRAPNIDDIGKVFDSEPGAVVVPNPNLKPEYAYNAEIAAILDFGKTFSFNAAFYYTLLENALVRRPFSIGGEETIMYQGEMSEVLAIQNAANAYVYGFEAGAKVYFSEELELASQIVLTKGYEELEDGTEAPLRHASPLFGESHLTWQDEQWLFDLSAEYNAELNYEELAPSEQSKAYLYAVDAEGNPYYPSWYSINFTAQYQLNETWNFTASLNNITDQRYRTYSSGISAAGRNFIMAVQYKF